MTWYAWERTNGRWPVKSPWDGYALNYLWHASSRLTPRGQYIPVRRSDLLALSEQYAWHDLGRHVAHAEEEG